MRFMKYLTIVVLLAVQYSFQDPSTENSSSSNEEQTGVELSEDTNLSNQVQPFSTETHEEDTPMNVLTKSVQSQVENKNKLLKGVNFKKNFIKGVKKTKNVAQKAAKKGKKLMGKMFNGIKNSLKKLSNKKKGSKSSSSSDSSSSEDHDRRKRFLKFFLPQQVSSQIKDIGGHVLNHLF